MAAKKKTKKAAAKKSPAKKAAKKPAKKSAKSAGRPNAPIAKPIPHPIVHWEIQSQNPVRLHKFYADALGWKIDANNQMAYGMVASKGVQGINGGIGGTEGAGSRVLVYAAVKSIPSLLERIETHGGRTIMPRTDIGPVVMALYQDPEGNLMGLIEGSM